MNSHILITNLNICMCWFSFHKADRASMAMTLSLVVVKPVGLALVG